MNKKMLGIIQFFNKWFSLFTINKNYPAPYDFDYQFTEM